MIITAKATHISHTPRKVNLVIKSIVGLPADKALEKLQFTMKRASDPVIKVLRQAIGNATNNFALDPKTLIVDTAFATKGRTLKRALFGGHMRYKPFERTASHLTINLRSVAPKAISAKKTVAPQIETVKPKVTTKTKNK